MARWKRVALNLAGMLAVALLVDVTGRAIHAPLEKLAIIIWRLLTTEGLLLDLWHTTRRFLVGYALAVATGVPVGILVGRSRVLAAIFDAPIELLRPIPSAVVIPLALAYLGIGEQMKVFVVWFGAFWPLLVVTRNGARHIEKQLLDVARVYHLSPLRTLAAITVPAIVPHVLGATRAALAIALLLAVTVEMIAGGDPTGLGFFILDSERSFQQGNMLAGIVILAVLGFVANAAFSLIEKSVTRRRFSYYETP